MQLHLVGPEFSQAAAAVGRLPESVVLHPSREALAEWLGRTPVENALVLIKGSRGIGLEKIIEML